MKRLHILSIGRDVTGLTPNTPLFERWTLYDTYHTFTHIIMARGLPKHISVGSSTVITAGGTNPISVFLRTVVLALRFSRKDNTIKLVTTQDVLYAGLIGYIISRLKNKPLYVQLHGDYLDNPLWFKSKVGLGNRAMNHVGKWILRRADAVRVVSNRLLKQIFKEQGVGKDKLISIPIGTDLSIFSKTENQVREKIILFVGRLIPEKEPILFAKVAIKICQKYHDVKIGIAGDGFLKKEMEDLFKTANLIDRVVFYGSLPQLELAAIYAKSYCYIHTAGWEGWGMPMIESMAAGCPVVTTDSGCAGEAIKHRETGMVVGVDDEDALFSATQMILDDSVLWQKLVDNGKKEAQHWSLDYLAKLNMDWYARVK